MGRWSPWGWSLLIVTFCYSEGLSHKYISHQWYKTVVIVQLLTPFGTVFASQGKSVERSLIRDERNKMPINPLMPVDTLMCHNIISLKRRMIHLCVITEHAKFKLFCWHYKPGAATSATGVL